MARKPRKSKGTWSTHEHEIFDGAGKVFRTAQSGENYQFSMWLPSEKKYLRKTLKTRDLETALTRGKELYLQTYADIQTGKKMFGMTLQELVDNFLEYRNKDVETKRIVKGRWVTIRSQCRHVLAYKSPNLKIAELDRDSFYDYETYRKTVSGAKDVTIRNEQATINEMVRYAYRQGYTHIDKFNFRPIKISKSKIGRRDIFSPAEYDSLIRHLRSYISKTECPVEAQRLERQLIRDAVLIASNTMLRVGEFWQLKWRDIVKVDTVFDSTERPITLVTINVRNEISKNGDKSNPEGTSRTIITRGGEYFDRVRSYQQHIEPNNFVFASINGTKPISKNKQYLHWKNLMHGIGIENYKERKLTWYSLRHFAITCRIRAGNTYGEISQMAGTHASHIENHYGHWDMDMKREAAVKNFSFDRYGISITD